MKTANKNQEEKITVQLFFTGIVIYMTSTLALITTKILFWSSINGWWILLPPVLVTLVGLVDIVMTELSHTISPLAQIRRLALRLKFPFQSVH